MDANELMIGDWVQYTDIIDDWGYVPQGKVSKLTHHATFDEQKGSRIQIELPDGFQFFNDIEEHFFPIPLTPEILEKNGYRNSVLVDDYYIAHGIHYNVDSKYIMFGYEYGSVLEVKCEYVHELQHALRLAGIKKEIVL